MRARRTALVLLLAAAVLLPAVGCRTLRRRAGERPPYRKVSPAVAFEIIHDSPDILVLDLRPRQAFNSDTGHLFRAFNIPVSRLPTRIREISRYRDETFLVYCDTPSCAEEGMAVLISSGFENAILIDGGIDNWIRMGFRTVLPEDIAGRAAERAQAAGTEPATDSPAAPPVAEPPPAEAPPPR
ncbi:MAG TPA: rhodanese-like domain-containing protein [Thermoanaerobaculia bacterium]